ncbi:MAG: methionyl-tRNA formyltransferase [Caulobacteraceae bacterium]
MRLIFLGTPQFAVPSLAALLEANHQIAAVYSQPPAERGRGRRVSPSPVAAFAAARNFEVRTPVSLRGPQEEERFAALSADAAVTVAFGQILGAAILDAPRLGAFNLHASLLPRWRGAAPIQRAIMAGDAQTGVCVMRMSEGLDEGPLLACQTLAIAPLETAGGLHDRLAKAGARLLVSAMGEVERGSAVETPQSEEGATYARKIRGPESRLSWSRPSQRIDAQIRGLSPHPGAWFLAPSERGGDRLKVLLSRPEPGQGSPGEVLDDRLLIACEAGAVRLLTLQREGRRPQEAEEFLRGFPIPAGARLA